MQKQIKNFFTICLIAVLLFACNKTGKNTETIDTLETEILTEAEA